MTAGSPSTAFGYTSDIHGRVGEAGGFARSGIDRDGGELAARIPGSVGHGPGWSNLYARPGNAGRNMDLSQVNRFRPATVARGEANDVFADHNGGVFRRSEGGWQQRSGDIGQRPGWSAYGRTPEAQPRFQSQSFAAGRFDGGAYGHPEGGLERDFGARSRGLSRASNFGNAGGGFHGGGGGFHGGGGFYGGGGGGRR